MARKNLQYEGYTGLYSLETYKKLIQTASKANPSPNQSNFHVMAAGMTLSGKFISGGNIEYAITDAIHGEESLVTLANQLHPKDPLVLIGFKGTKDLKPCGNCRDLLREYATPDLEIVTSQDSTLENATIHRFQSTFLINKFEETSTNSRDTKAIDRAFSALANSYDVFVPQNKKRQLYGAAITSIIGIFSGGFEGCVAFDPTLPLRSAANALIYSGTNQERFKLHNATIVSFEMPDVLYKDRQQLTELVQRLGNAGGANPLPIKLVQVKPTPAGRYQIERAWQTNSDQWFPKPFSPKALGLDDQVKQHYRRVN